MQCLKHFINLTGLYTHHRSHAKTAQYNGTENKYQLHSVHRRVSGHTLIDCISASASRYLKERDSTSGIRIARHVICCIQKKALYNNQGRLLINNSKSHAQWVRASRPCQFPLIRFRREATAGLASQKKSKRQFEARAVMHCAKFCLQVKSAYTENPSRILVLI